MPDPLDPKLLVSVIVILALAFLVACSFAWLYRGEALYRRHRESFWRSRARAYRREAVLWAKD